jgi:hypothetical protein
VIACPEPGCGGELVFRSLNFHVHSLYLPCLFVRPTPTNWSDILRGVASLAMCPHHCFNTRSRHATKHRRTAAEFSEFARVIGYCPSPPSGQCTLPAAELPTDWMLLAAAVNHSASLKADIAESICRSASGNSADDDDGAADGGAGSSGRLLCELCEEGEEAVATAFCTNPICGHYMCAGCTARHSKTKKFKTHAVVEAAHCETAGGSAIGGNHLTSPGGLVLGGGNGAGVGTICAVTAGSPTAPECPAHAGKHLEVFCHSCNKMVCLMCAVFDHKAPEHDVGELTFMAARNRAEIVRLKVCPSICRSQCAFTLELRTWRHPSRLVRQCYGACGTRGESPPAATYGAGHTRCLFFCPFGRADNPRHTHTFHIARTITGWIVLPILYPSVDYPLLMFLC